MLKNCQISVNILNKNIYYDIINIPRGYDIFSIKPTKDINRGANTNYVLNACYKQES